MYRFEAESGALTGTQVASSTPGYSGTGYVTGFDRSSDKVRVQANLPSGGLYELWLRYNSPYGKKGYGVQGGTEVGSGMFDGTASSTFSLDRAGLFNLNAGTNTLEVRNGWGYYNLDYFELRPATARPVAPVAPALSDPLATTATRQLMGYMSGIYGSKTLAGQQGPINSTYLSRSGGLAPAVSGADFIEYSPSRLQHGSNPNNETERMVNWARANGGVATMMWHWNAPTGLIDTPGHEWWRGFYTDSTTFNFKTALDNPNSPEYALILRDIDAIAVELKKFQDAGVPVVWRPLHEAQGGWFWWGAQGPAAFRDLWRLMYDRLTDHHGLHNLIWTFTSSAAEQGHLDWYPGDDVVDVVGADVYTDKLSSMSGEWLDLLDHYNGRKLIALSETGTLPSAQTMGERALDWSWFTPWSLNDVLNNYTAAELRALLASENVVTLNELPVVPWNANALAWAGDAGGNWSEQTNWTGGIANAAAATLNFGAAITAPRTVAVDVARTVGFINFDNANKYTIAGPGTITLDRLGGGAVGIRVASGSHEISAPLVLAKDATFDVAPSTATLTLGNLQPSSVNVTKAGNGALVVNNFRAASLTVSAGTASVAANGTAAGTSKLTNGLAVAAGATLDLSDNDLVVGPATSKASIETLIRDARDNGAWDRPGLTSSAARTRAANTTALGVLTGTEYTSVGGTGAFSGQTYSAGDTLVKYTWNGDANFDAQVTFDDYVKIDTGFNQQLTGWLNGDFNYSGQITFDDYVLIDVAFNQQNGTLSRAIDWVSGDDQSGSGGTGIGVESVIEHLEQFGSAYGAAFLAAVPEPCAVGALASLALVRRRRRFSA